jgi:AraC-like DNA-binding protein
VRPNPTFLPAQPASPEQGAWDSVRSGWHLLFGGFHTRGVSIEHHEFSAGDELDWSRSFHADSVELCLNLSGNGRLVAGQQVCELPDSSVTCYGVGADKPRATRTAKEAHRFITIEFRREYLKRQLEGCAAAVHPVVRPQKGRRKDRPLVSRVNRLSSSQQAFAQRLADPPVTAAALPLWFEAKVNEAIAEFLFEPEPEMFCQRQQRLARERVERVQEILRQRLECPPTLEELGREVGVSQYYLSRIFSQEARMTIPQFLRQVRMEAAAALLRAGSHNVTQAAFAVGYSSLGHFSKSFCEVVGCCPTLYPLAKNLAPGRV